MANLLANTCILWHLLEQTGYYRITMPMTFCGSKSLIAVMKLNIGAGIITDQKCLKKSHIYIIQDLK